jgi:D-beta-D-heptose 7-phosphate kinase/D-beta-D-heptose 1-phosphate adenosyltransferase
VIVVLGDVMSDVYVDGHVHRISPDAPVPVLLRTGTSRRASGACLSAGAAARRGPRGVAVIGVVGDDETARFLRASMREAGVEPLLGTVPGCTSITKTRFRTGEHHLLRVDDDSTFGQHPTTVRDLVMAAWQQVRQSASAVLISDYDKGTLTAASVRQVIADSKADGLPVVVDSKRRDLVCFRGARVWTPNTAELEASGQADDETGQRLTCERLDLDAIIVTRAGRGATVTLREGGHQHVPVPSPARVRSVAGAGDILAGVVAALAAQGVGWTKATVEGVRAATEFAALQPTQEPVPASSRPRAVDVGPKPFRGAR